MSRGSWTFVRSTPIHSRGKLTLREDVWRLPTGHEETHPVLAVGVSRVIPFGEALAMALDDRVTESVSKIALLAAGLKRGIKPGTIL